MDLILFVKLKSGRPGGGSPEGPRRRPRWLLVVSATLCSALVVLYVAHPDARPVVRSVIDLLLPKH